MAQQSSHHPHSARGGKPARRGKDRRGTSASAGGQRQAKSSSVGSGQRSVGSPAGVGRQVVGRSAGAASGAAPSRRKLKDSAGPCPIMRACGGCAWLGIPYRKQLIRKQEAMEELFRPLIERMGWDAAIEATCGMGSKARDPGKAPAPRAFRYKAATPFAPGPAGAVRSGFFARGTHTIVPAHSCAVEAPGARNILNEVARAAERLGIPAYDEDARQGVLRYAVLRMGWRTDEAMLTIVTARREVPHIEDLARELSSIDPRIVCVAQNINGREGNAILGRETRVLWGAPHMKDELLGCTFAISPTAFYQTNPQQTEVLYRLAIKGMALEAGDVLLDAYCGSGTIGLCAARDAARAGKAIKLIGVEKNPAGIADAPMPNSTALVRMRPPSWQPTLPSSCAMRLAVARTSMSSHSTLHGPAQRQRSLQRLRSLDRGALSISAATLQRRCVIWRYSGNRATGSAASRLWTCSRTPSTRKPSRFSNAPSTLCEQEGRASQTDHQ